MQVLNNSQNLDSFFNSLADQTSGVLLLDYDGTLAPFQLERDAAVPYSGVRERLVKLIESPRTRVIIISGRWTRDLVPLIGLEQLPEIWGCHGAERMGTDGSYEIASLPEEVVEGLVNAEDWARAEGLEKYCERKPISVAFHWRGLPDNVSGDIATKVRGRFVNAPMTPSLVLKEFDGGLELKYADITKARAVSNILEEVSPETPIAYLGDDLTDEDAFRALDGHGLRVLVRPKLRDTAADVWLQPPGELLEFLDRWLDAT
ncbi:trehalose-phosphatase [candidate division GN15 bacterium]|nr:trehalose-phosphatase [candidate division GN15 bacterium]